MKRLLLATILAAGVWPVAARAAPYWVAWEGNDYPENEGWERLHYFEDGPVANRSLSDGVMTLDGLASLEIIDSYRMIRPLDPEPGEEFVAQWGLRVNEVTSFYPYDPGFSLTSDDGWRVTMAIGTTEIHSVLDRRDFAISETGFLAWEFRSPDMRSYSLSVNGVILGAGTFREVGIQQSRVYWGDLVAGATSSSDWDYFRFGVVPEPHSGSLLLALLFAAQASNSTRRMS